MQVEASAVQAWFLGFRLAPLIYVSLILKPGLRTPGRERRAWRSSATVMWDAPLGVSLRVCVSGYVPSQEST